MFESRANEQTYQMLALQPHLIVLYVRFKSSGNETSGRATRRTTSLE